MVECMIQFQSASIAKYLIATKKLPKIKIQAVSVLSTGCGTGSMYRHGTPGSTTTLQILPWNRAGLFRVKLLPPWPMSALNISGFSTSAGRIRENEPKKRAVFWDMLILLVLYIRFCGFPWFCSSPYLIFSSHLGLEFVNGLFEIMPPLSHSPRFYPFPTPCHGE